MRKFIDKFQIAIFFFSTTLLGYGPWLVTGRPAWFIYGMPVSGMLLTIYLKGLSGFIGQLKAALTIKAPLLEYFKIFLLLVLSNIFALLFAYMLFGDIPSFTMVKTEPLLIPVLLIVIFTGGPLVEEVFGLRGYVLPELLKKWSPLASSSLVGFYFGAWHLVEFFRPGSTQYAIGLNYYPLFIISEIAVSILMTDVYIRNNGNLFLAGVFFHWMMNNAVILFQTELTLSGIEYSPEINEHYFVLYSLILCLVSIYVVLKNKLFLKKNREMTEA